MSGRPGTGTGGGTGRGVGDSGTNRAAAEGVGRTGFVEMVRKANAPQAPEHSLVFRAATLASVLTGVFACASTGELSFGSALAAGVAISVGMAFSAATRRRPWQWVKILLAFAVIFVFVQFVRQVFGAAHTGELSSIEVPLAGLFTWVQVVHAFDVPARRDLLFSVAAAAALVTVAAAQAVSVGFLVFVAIWLVSSMVALGCSWRSMAGGEGRLPSIGLAGATVVILVVAVGLELVLPPPRASQEITLPNSLTSYLALPSGGGLTQGGRNPSEPAQAGRPGGQIGIGGFVGMDGPLDTADRGSLGNEVVMRVRADRPGYFLGLTYSSWDGQSWTNPSGCPVAEVDTGSPFQVPTTPDGGGTPFLQSTGDLGGAQNVQTFYVLKPLPNLLFATSVPAQIYFPDHSLVFGCDNSVRSTVAMTPGTVYTVISQDTEATPAQLAGVPASVFESPYLRRTFAADLELPKPDPYGKVSALARSIVAAARPTSLVGEIQALENWIGAHTQYSTNIPPLLPGQDAVNQFLFGNRVGYCEQISTALAVMLRTLGVPTREATGYVPGPFEPLSDLYDIQARDAHAWVQVYFPGQGWQSFDPTAYVPLAPANPGAVLLSDMGHLLAGLPWLPIGTGGGLAAAVLARRYVIRRRRALPPTWAGRLALRLERAGARAGVVRGRAETLAEYAGRLSRSTAGVSDAELRRLVELVSAAAYAGREPTPDERLAAEATVESLRRQLRHGGGTTGGRRRVTPTPAT